LRCPRFTFYLAKQDFVGNFYCRPRGALAISVPAGETRVLKHYLDHKNIQHTVRYTELSP
jgi:hypothetical protein